MVWKVLSGGIFELYEIVPGVLFATLAVVAVSLIGPQPPDEVSGRFERYRDLV